MSQPMEYVRELETARLVALEAAALVARFKHTDIEVREKGGGEPVTQADIASSDLIVRRLRQAFPDDAILSEEIPDDGARLHASRVWMIDPIDGTRDFIRGEAGYVVMLGLCVEGRPVVGVVVQPTTDVLWMGAEGQGAWKEQAGYPRQPLHVSQTREPSRIRLVASKSHPSEHQGLFRKALGVGDVLRVGSVGLKVALIAEGTRDLYAYPGGQTKIWDSCGPEAILVAAGGSMTDAHGNPLCYGETALQNPRGLVASNGLVHRLAIQTIADLRATSQQP